MKLYIVGRTTYASNFHSWEIMGIFDKEEDAVKLCKNNNYFVGPINLNEVLPEETIEWPDAYFPTAKVQDNE